MGNNHTLPKRDTWLYWLRGAPGSPDEGAGELDALNFLGAFRAA